MKIFITKATIYDGMYTSTGKIHRNFRKEYFFTSQSDDIRFSLKKVEDCWVQVKGSPLFEIFIDQTGQYIDDFHSSE